MLGIRPKISEHARNQSGASARINDPAGTNRAIFVRDRHGHGLAFTAVQLQRGHFGRTQQVAAGFHRLLQHVGIESRAIHLEAGQARAVAGADFDAIIE